LLNIPESGKHRSLCLHDQKGEEKKKSVSCFWDQS